MADKSQVMNDLAYVKKVIQALLPDHKKEFFNYFIKYSNLNKAVKNKTIHPSTPEPIASFSKFQKQPLNSPLTPKRSKKDNKVLCINILY